MKHLAAIFIFVLLFCTSLSVQSQNALIKENNIMRDKDYLVKLQIPHVNPGKRGESVLWNYDIPHLTGEEYIQYYSVTNDDIVCSEHGTLYRYCLKGDSLLHTGFENRTTRITYDIPQYQLSFPFQYKDSIEGYYGGTGIYSNRIHIGIGGFCYTVADAMGMLVNGTDTLKHVLRTHRHSEHICTTSIDSLSRNFDSIDNIKEVLVKESHVIQTEDVYQWYHYGSRYPVMETIESRQVSNDNSELLFATTFLYFPVDQEYDLPNDTENEKIRQYCESEESKPVEEKEKSPILIMEATVTDDGKSIHIHYELTSNSNIQINVFDAASRLLGNVSHINMQAGIYDEQVTFNALPVGDVVLLYINAGNEQIEVQKVNISH